MRLHAVRDTWAIVLNMEKYFSADLLAGDSDFRAGLRVFYGVVDQIDEYLCDQPCIHPGNQDIPAWLNDDLMMGGVFVNMLQRGFNHVISEEMSMIIKVTTYSGS